MNDMVVKKMDDVKDYSKEDEYLEKKYEGVLKMDDVDEYRERRYDEVLRRSSCDRYLPMFSPNSKQWWVYDECEDVYIDPPAAVLDRVDNLSFQILTMGSGLSVCDIGHVLLAEEIIKAMEAGGEWLDEREYWYDDIEI